jgi:hypothetical protein
MFERMMRRDCVEDTRRFDEEHPHRHGHLSTQRLIVSDNT